MRDGTVIHEQSFTGTLSFCKAMIDKRVERFWGRGGTRELEIRGPELYLRTGHKKRDEVTNVYASEADAILAADFIRDSWLAEGFKAESTGSGLILGSSAPPPPRAGGGFLLDASGSRVKKEPPAPIRRIEYVDPLAKDPKLAELAESGAAALDLEDGSVVAANVGIVDMMGSSKSPLKAVLASKLAKKTIRSLVCSIGEDERELKSTVTALAKGLPESLETLTLFEFPIVELFHDSKCDPTPAFGAMKSLRHLTLQAGAIAIKATPDLPELRSLHVRCAGLAREALAPLLAASWPRLEELTLWLGAERYGATVTAADLAPLLSGERTPALKTLRLQAVEGAEALVEPLLAAPLVRRLETLDLSFGLLDDAGLARLVASEETWRGLARLELRETAVTEAGAKKARAALGERLHFESQNGSNDTVEHFVPLRANGEYIYLIQT